MNQLKIFWNVAFLLIILSLFQSISASVCSTHILCSTCLEDSECGWCYEEGKCHKLNSTSYATCKLITEHCPSFFNWQLITGSICAFVGGALASGGGIGGGAVYVPVYVLLLGFSPGTAIPLSKVTILGVAIGGIIVLARKRHPKADRPLIDYSIALLMEPLTLGGTIIGVYLNMTFPTYILIICLVLILGFTTLKTFQKGVQLYKEEKELSHQEHRMHSGIVEEANEMSSEEQERQSLLQKRQHVLKKERSISIWKIISLILLEAGMLVLVLLKGGKEGSVIDVHCGSWQYWVLVASIAPYLGTFVAIVAYMLHREHKHKVFVGYSYLKEDLRWSVKNIIIFLVFATLAGIVAGFLGVGGGLITGPVLISMGVLPQVATATSSYMILFTSSATTAQFIILGRMMWQYGIWFFFIGILAAIVGQIIVAKIVQKYKKQAFINFLLAGVICLSTILLVALDSLDVVHSLKSHIPMEFHSICEANE